MKKWLFANTIKVSEFVEFINEFQAYYTHFGILTGLFLSWFSTIIPFVPLFFVMTLNILSFGFINGFILSYVGSALGVYTYFVYFRYILKDTSKLKNSKRLKSVIKYIDVTTPINHIIVFSIPYNPSFIISYSLGLSNMKLKTFHFVTLTSRLFLQLLLLPYSLLILKFFKEGRFSATIDVLFLVIISMVVLVISLIHNIKKARRSDQHE